MMKKKNTGVVRFLFFLFFFSFIIQACGPTRLDLDLQKDLLPEESIVYVPAANGASNEVTIFENSTESEKYSIWITLVGCEKCSNESPDITLKSTDNKGETGVLHDIGSKVLFTVPPGKEITTSRIKNNFAVKIYLRQNK